MRYKKLSHDIKCLLQFNEWLMWSVRCDEDFKTDYYEKYKHIRHWCVDVICGLGISYNDIPSVDDNNQNKVFKESRKILDLKAFKKINTHKFSVIFSDNDKYMPIIDKLD